MRSQHLPRVPLAQDARGFTFIELLVVVAIAGIMTTAIVTKFGRSSILLEQVVNRMVTEIRATQSRAASGFKFEGVHRCGFGFRKVTNQSYGVYAGPNASSTNCTAQNRNFDGSDTVVTISNLTDPTFEIQGAVSDIFFEPPDPTTFINNVGTLSTPPSTITVGPTGQSCDGLPVDKCRTICVYASGKIEVQDGGAANCPAAP